MRYRFDAFDLDTRTRELSRDGEPVPLEPQVFDLLALMLRHAGEVVTQDAIIEGVWNGRIVSDAAIATRVSALRRALGDDGQSQRLIRTLRGHGFRFLAPVEQHAPAAPAAPLAAVPGGARPVLAILPFDRIGPDDESMLADGIVEEITSTLSRVQEFDVIARQSAFALRGEALDIPAAAARLGADYVLQGSVRSAGDRVRVTITLARGHDGHAVSSDTFDDRMDDLFDMQDRIAAKVAGGLAPHLRQAEIRRISQSAPRDRSAYDLTLMALPHFWASRREALEEAVRSLGAALERDPDYAPALAYMAWARGQIATYMWSDDPLRDFAEARRFADRAARIASDHGPTLVAIGAAYSLASEDPSEGTYYIDHALEIDNSNAWGWMRRGWALHYEGRPEAGLEAFRRAELLSPLDPFMFNVYIGRASCLRKLGRLDESVEMYRAGMRMTPGTAWPYRQLIGVHMLNGDVEAAHAAARHLRAAHPGITRQYFLDSLPRSVFTHSRDYVDAVIASGIFDD